MTDLPCNEGLPEKRGMLVSPVRFSQTAIPMFSNLHQTGNQDCNVAVGPAAPCSGDSLRTGKHSNADGIHGFGVSFLGTKAILSSHGRQHCVVNVDAL